jgi:hypothetical protein
MLIDDYLPRWDVRERHRVVVRAAAAEVWSALRTADLASSPLVGALLGIRGLPGALARGRAGVAALGREARAPITLASFESRGFRVLEERPREELLIGLEGQFWRPTGRIATPDVDAFRDGRPPAAGTARAVWNFTLDARATPGPGAVELRTETRVLCADAATRRRFLPYWWIIRPGSGLIRRAMLHAIRRHAESSTR